MESTNLEVAPPVAQALALSESKKAAMLLNGVDRFAYALSGLASGYSFSDGSSGISASAISEQLRARLARLRGGDLSDIERDLGGQAAYLQALFAHFARKAQLERNQATSKGYLDMALMAQRSAAKTVSALAAIRLQQMRS
jgi:hypothetical protein